MKSICNRTRVTDPAGIWDYRNLIGAQVRISSNGVSNLNRIFAFDATRIHIIDDIYFRVTTDGKTITVIKLKDMPDFIFTWKDLEVLNLCIPEPEPDNETKCGQKVYCSENTICG